MCVVSAISDHYKDIKWDDYHHWDKKPAYPMPVVIHTPPTEAEVLKKIMDLIKQARELDKLTGEPDCEDPKKTQWIRDVEKRLDELEEEVYNKPKKIEKIKLPRKHKNPRE